MQALEQNPLEAIDFTHWDVWQRNEVLPYFARLRAEDPVHYTPDSRYGPFWSITRHADIKEVDTTHEVFSSASGIGILDIPDANSTSFISMDPPTHDVQRKTVAPVVAPRNLASLEGVIRERVETILNSLPIGETFNWVDKVSIELTAQMLSTILGFPFEDRRRLTFWSDCATGGKELGVVASNEERQAALQECLAVFTDIWHQRAAETDPGFDLISMLAHGKDTKNMIERPMEYLGNLLLLIVGGNDTTRNSISGGVLALNQFPEEFDKLKANPDIIPNMVAEIIRWQTPLAHMRRTALQDYKLGGKTIKAGDKVLMWYLSGNRDETVFPDADRLQIDRHNARMHVSFGYGIHRCMGNRLAEMQLRIVWEEILKRFKHVKVMDEPTRVRSNFVRGYSHLPVQLEAL